MVVICPAFLSAAPFETIRAEPCPVTTLKLAFRALLKMRSTTLVVVLTFAVGIAANLVVFAPVNTALIRPLPFSDLNGKSAGVSGAKIEDIERAPSLFDGAAAYMNRNSSLIRHTNNSLDVALTWVVTPDLL